MESKWVIYKDLDTNQKIFRLGLVGLHMELLPKTKRTCLGGGKFILDKDKKTIYLFGISFDFGCVHAEEFTKDLWIQSVPLMDFTFKFSNELTFDRIKDWTTLTITKDNFS